MEKVFDFFQLIRFKNLLIVAFTQYLIRYTLSLPLLTSVGLNDLQFFLLVLSTILIAAAGYIINDYFDIQVDQLNKRKVIIGSTIKRREAMAMHFLLSGVGVFVGFYLGWVINVINFGFINLFSASALWFYSTHFKRNYLSGNLLISLLAALVLMIVALYDLIPSQDPNSEYVFYIICIYALFAFITTFIREVLKDLEDMEGDQKMGYKTFAIVSGIRKSKKAVTIISSLTILAVGWILHSQFNSDIYSFIYVCLAIEIPFIYFLFKLQKANSSADFHSLSTLIKIIMLTGTLSILIFSLVY